MKRVWQGMALAVTFTLVISGAAMGQSGMMAQGQMGQPGQRPEATDRGQGGMMGHPGMSGGMGMMGAGRGGQPQPPSQISKSPLTQEDTQGAVTVSVTLLTADKPRADGRLAIQVKLDTHAVDLDQYKLEKLATLRDAEGREIPAVALESPSGSGHHREGVLTFPGTDANGNALLNADVKGLTLLIRGIDAVPERVFRWQLPLG